MKSQFEEATTLLESHGLKKEAALCKKLAAGKSKVYVITKATPYEGLLHWHNKPEPRDYRAAEEYPNVFFDIRKAKAAALEATIKFVRSTPLSSFWFGMCDHAINFVSFESCETIAAAISEIYGKPFTGEEEFLATTDTSDAALGKVIKKLGYHKYRAEPIPMST